ncbi:MAG: type II toxin-antitoxin system VapC family toxin [Nitrosospira sp.]|nr:type II toxin-antitoxin system VapC family toxin [Nitrosospira sp.]MDN5881294.1 type II toxin-antitoxin system VapC family toxin [Nitrosospira sp.]MDN5936227.1 type II toxin-antitoxin system VapC family toxin [Nitrosospira sp.]
MRYMFDTNFCIYLMRRHPPEVAKRFATMHYGDVVISAIVLAELRYGVERYSESRALAEQTLFALLQDIVVLSFEANAAVSYGLLRAAIRDRKRDALDRLIAAHAASLSLTLVTNNVADFKDYPGLIVENWISLDD